MLLWELALSMWSYEEPLIGFLRKTTCFHWGTPVPFSSICWSCPTNDSALSRIPSIEAIMAEVLARLNLSRATTSPTSICRDSYSTHPLGQIIHCRCSQPERHQSVCVVTSNKNGVSLFTSRLPLSVLLCLLVGKFRNFKKQEQQILACRYFCQLPARASLYFVCSSIFYAARKSRKVFCLELAWVGGTSWHNSTMY